jgi:hypothetical protein
MHERVQYLAEQAILEGPQGEVDFKEFINVYTELFSQLLIEECAQIADTAEPYQAADLIRQLRTHKS